MVEFLFELPMDLQFYLLFMSAMLPVSLFVVHHYFGKVCDTSIFANIRSTYDIYIKKSLHYPIDIHIETVVNFIVFCIRLKDSPNDDKDDHHLLLTP